MATLQDIKSPIWGYSIQGGGAIAEGLASIRQCIDIIIRTTPGTDPLRPLFGSDVYKYIDYPADVAIPNIKAAILDAITTWEKRVVVTSLKHRLDISTLYIDINYRLSDDTLNDLITVIIDNGGISTGVIGRRLILQGYFPANPFGFQYQIQCILNNNEILPAPPAEGFADAGEMYLWVKTNWSSYGQWYLTAESIVGYMNPEYTTGSLTISLLNVLRFQGLIPGLPVGNKYVVSITVDGQLYESTEDLLTADQVRQWAQDNIAQLGTWKIEGVPGSFNDDFNDDFETYKQLLVIVTDQADSVIIDVYTDNV